MTPQKHWMSPEPVSEMFLMKSKHEIRMAGDAKQYAHLQNVNWAVPHETIDRKMSHIYTTKHITHTVLKKT